MNQIILLLTLLLWISQSKAQHYDIQLRDSITSFTSSLSVEYDSLYTTDSGTVRTLNISSSKILNSHERYQDLHIKIINSGDEVSLQQEFIHNGKVNNAITKFTPDSSHVLYFVRISDDAIESHAFKMLLDLNHLTLQSNTGLYGEFTSRDTTLSFMIIPYIFTGPVINLGRRTARIKNLNHRLYIGESFRLNDAHYKFENFNTRSKTIGLTEVSHSQASEGYKTGKRLTSATSIINTINNAPKSNNVMNETTQYYLLHFWGEWCVPCKKNIPFHLSLYDQLDHKKITLVNVALLRKNEHSHRNTLDIIESYGIPGIHLTEGSSHTSLHIISATKTSVYPSYILIDARGYVLHRTDVSPVPLQQVLQRLKLTRH